jgi:hypothetical protein
MNNLSQECKDEIEVAAWLYSQYDQAVSTFIDGATEALTNPTIYQSAGLMTVEEALRFAEWVQYECIRYDGDWILEKKIYTTTDLLNIFRNQNQEKWHRITIS